MKYVSLDCEMTGLDVERHQVIEFAAIIDDLANPKPLSELPRFHCYFLHDVYAGDPEVLVMHVELLRRIAQRSPGYDYLYARKFGNTFKKFLIENGFEVKKDRVTINVAGKNFARHDWAFLEAQTDFFKHVQIRARVLDPGILYMKVDDDTLPSLSTCKERAGISDMTVKHEATDDAFDVIDLIRRHFGGTNEG